jgi:hypothetical protein
MNRIKLVMICLQTVLVSSAWGAPAFTPNYDEAKVPAYTLPDPLAMADGSRVTDAETWTSKRRSELLNIFEEHVYGRSPSPLPVSAKVVETDPQALGGLATRKQVVLTVGEGQNTVAWDLLMYLPNAAKKPVPVFLGLNFHGNHTVHSDPAIRLPKGWVRDEATTGAKDHVAQEGGRGSSSRRWPLEAILKRGYGVVTLYCGDIDPDFDDGFQNGVHGLFPEDQKSPRDAHRWGTVGAWAWGLSRVMDYLVTDQDVDSKRVAVLGHSRLGKAALWAGAQDARFAIVISNDSGCAGAALSRRAFGETVERINNSFPHWFCTNFRQYNKREAELPVDQHELIALVAPRPVYIASASEDLWADPRGEFLAAKGAEPVYRLFNKPGLPAQDFPKPDESFAGTIGYHLRPGKHDILEYDWQRYLDFADRQYGADAAR